MYANMATDIDVEAETLRKIFVGGLPLDVDDDEIKAVLQNAITGGNIVDCNIIRKDTGKKKTFGFITFETCEMVDELLLMRPLKYKNNEIDVKRAVPRDDESGTGHIKTKDLFVANLSKTCTVEQLKQYFEEYHNIRYGSIETVQLIKKKDEEGNKTDENKGFGFMTVSSEDMADKMVILHKKFDFDGRVCELKKKEERGGGEGGRGRGGPRGGRGRGGPRGGRGGYGGGYDAYSYGNGGGYDAYSYGNGGGYEGYGGGGYGYGGGSGYGYGGGGGGYGGGQPTRSRGGGRGYRPY